MTTKSESTQVPRPLGRIACVSCWWFGCEPHPQDPGWPDELECMHCSRNIPYCDLVGDTRHNRMMDWIRHWLFHRWIPEKCPACGARFSHCNNCDGIPF